MLLGVRLFVLVVFLLLGLSFLVTTAVLMWEFYDTGWLTLATFYSHLFIFFPTFGVVTLCAFYMPACVFTDMYWRHVKLGKVRFVFGFIVVAGVSWWISGLFGTGRERSMFDIRPAVLAADSGEPARCSAGSACRRMPVLEAAGNVRAVSQQRIGLSDLVRACRPDRLIELPPEAQQRKRFCFASTPLPAGQAGASAPLVGDRECCAAQAEFSRAVTALAGSPSERSLTGQVHRAVLFGKIFFMLVLLVISILLAARRRSLDVHYKAHLSGIERGVLIGAVAMVIYPIMSHAFLQSAALLYGEASTIGYRATAPYFTFAFGAWALLLLFFFWQRRNKDLQEIGRLGGLVAGGVAIFKYDLIIDVFVRVFGSGASLATLSALTVFAVFSLVALFVQTSDELSHPAEPQPAHER